MGVYSYSDLDDAFITSQVLHYLSALPFFSDMESSSPSFRALAREFPSLLGCIELDDFFQALHQEAKKRALKSEPLFKLAFELRDHLIALVSLFGIDEQLFILSQRHQMFEKNASTPPSDFQAKFYNRQSGKVEERTFSQEDFEKIVGSYEKEPEQSQAELLSRLLTSDPWPRWKTFETRYLTPEAIDKRSKEFQ